MPDDSENGDPALYDIYLSAASRLRRRHTVPSLGQRSTTRKLYSDGARRRRGSTLPRSYRRHRRLRLWHTIPRRLAHYCMLSTRMTRSMRSSLGNTQVSFHSCVYEVRRQLTLFIRVPPNMDSGQSAENGLRAIGEDGGDVCGLYGRVSLSGKPSKGSRRFPQLRCSGQYAFNQ